MTAPLPDFPFDAIVSTLAIHHLEHDDQRALQRIVHQRLRPGGVYRPWRLAVLAVLAAWKDRR